MIRFAVIALAAALGQPADKPLKVVGPVEFRGTILGDMELSGAAVVGDYLVIVSNDQVQPQVLKKDGDGYVVHKSVPVPHANTHNLDLEATAAEGSIVYLTGSHGRVRNIGVKGNVVGVGGVEARRHRDCVFRFTLGADGTPGPVERTSLWSVLDAHPVLGPFRALASKENGVDIEGLAVKDGRLYFGFRGPVLRDRWVPVLSCTFDDPSGTARTLYVQLGGRGVRDMVAVDDGFLILAGPTGDGDWSFRIYHWDGKDGLNDADPGKTRRLADLPRAAAGKPEGLTVLGRSGDRYDLLLLYDGAKGGAPTRLSLKVPGR